MYENYQILRRRGYADWLVIDLGRSLNCPLSGAMAQWERSGFASRRLRVQPPLVPPPVHQGRYEIRLLRRKYLRDLIQRG